MVLRIGGSFVTKIACKEIYEKAAQMLALGISFSFLITNISVLSVFLSISFFVCLLLYSLSLCCCVLCIAWCQTSFRGWVDGVEEREAKQLPDANNSMQTVSTPFQFETRALD